MAELDDYTEIAEEYIDSCYGNIDRLAREMGSNIRDYIDIESFASNLFYDYTFVDGYVFYNYKHHVGISNIGKGFCKHDSGNQRYEVTNGCQCGRKYLKCSIKLHLYLSTGFGS